MMIFDLNELIWKVGNKQIWQSRRLSIYIEMSGNAEICSNVEYQSKLKLSDIVTSLNISMLLYTLQKLK